MKKTRGTTIARYLGSILFLFGICFYSTFAAAAPKALPAQENVGLNINTIKVEELQNLYQKSGYTQYVPRNNQKIPAIFLRSFPTDFNTITDDNLRNQLFIQILSPLALRINQEILVEREKLEKIIADFDNKGELNAQQSAWVEEMAKKYNTFTRLKGQRRYKLLLADLLRKIDIIPPSILIAVSAIETNWGQSRIIKEGHSLYKEVIWHSEVGLIPQDETEDKEYKIRIFPSLLESMRSYALNLNSNVNFENMRHYRKENRYRALLIEGRSIAPTLFLISPMPNYIGLLDYTITFYELDYVDASQLTYDFNKHTSSEKKILTKP